MADLWVLWHQRNKKSKQHEIVFSACLRGTAPGVHSKTIRKEEYYSEVFLETDRGRF